MENHNSLSDYTKEELLELARDMLVVADKTYWLFFTSNMGGRCHTFIEFNGLISKYAEIAKKCAERGIDFTSASVHSGALLPVEEHDLMYIAEKLRCIFGPILDNDPAKKKKFLKVLAGRTQG
jgi:hypothetical protein